MPMNGIDTSITGQAACRARVTPGSVTPPAA